MSLFPTYIEEDQGIEKYTEKAQIPKEYEIDFKTGEFTGNMVEGFEAIKVWIWLTMKTARYRYVIYSWDYGNELEELVGTGYTNEFVQSEVERILNETLLMNENILSISDISFIRDKEKISTSFTANTLYGEVSMNV